MYLCYIYIYIYIYIYLYLYLVLYIKLNKIIKKLIPKYSPSYLRFIVNSLGPYLPFDSCLAQFRTWALALPVQKENIKWNLEDYLNCLFYNNYMLFVYCISFAIFLVVLIAGMYC